MPAAFQILAVQNIARYIAPLIDRRQNPIPDTMRMLGRTPDVPRTDAELVMSHNSIVLAADVIADDQQARVKQVDTFTPQTNGIINLKHGLFISQEMQNFLQRMNAQATLPGEDDFFRNYAARKLADLVMGIRMRKEMLCWQMALGSSTYSGLGIKWSNVTFGMPAECLVTVATLWSNPAATPITDIQTALANVQIKWGKTYNRIEMSTQDFTNLINTNEFKAKAQLYSGFTFPANSFPVSDFPLMQTFVGRLLNMTIELNDFQGASVNEVGTVTYQRYLPTGKVRISNTADDGNANARDFGQGIVTESLVMNMPGVSVVGAGGVQGPRYGPIGYATVRPDLNPPNATLWAVDRGFPEKNDKTESLVLTVG